MDILETIKDLLAKAVAEETTETEKTVAVLEANTSVDGILDLIREKDELILTLQEKIDSLSKTNQELIKRELLRKDENEDEIEEDDSLWNLID